LYLIAISPAREDSAKPIDLVRKYRAMPQLVAALRARDQHLGLVREAEKVG